MAEEKEPLTVLAASAALQHELYLAYVGAGFTPAQAMQLLCTALTAVTTAAAASTSGQS